MANWAMVIGIDKYWTREACLKGAVHDALQMREWLLDPRGGNVPRGNLSLLLAPTRPVAEGLQDVEATRRNIIHEVNRLLARSGGKGERLYFHYSGHGLTNRVNQNDEDVLIPTDFDDIDPSLSIGLWSVIRRMQATQFLDQFFTIDACRNIPWEGEYVTGSWPWVEKRNPALPAVQQFVFYATSPGVTAAEIGEAGNERGAFTSALLEGLRGRAKAWDSSATEYIVRVERLCEYVEARLEERQVQVESGAASRLIQIPRLTGERGGRPQPALARFSLEEVNKETLEVYLEPSEVVSVAEVTVLRDFGLVEQRTQLSGLPVSFQLHPMEYNVRAQAANYEAVQKSWLTNLYQPEKVTVKLAARSGSTGDIGDRTGDDTSDLSREDSGGQRGLGRRPSTPESTTLIVESSDYLAPLEVTDTTGAVLETGQGRIESTTLGSGYYHVGIRMPEGHSTKKLVELGPGETEVIHLDAPEPAQTRLVQEMLEGASVEAKDDNTLKVSEPAELGPLASPQVSTLVTLAGGVANRGEREVPTHRRRSLDELQGFRSIVGDEATSGLYYLVGLDSHDSEEARNLVSGMKTRFWAQGEAIPESSEHFFHQHSSVSGLAEYAQSAVPSPYWLSIELPEQQPIVSVVTVLPQHLSMLICDREANGEIRLFQYLPRLEAHVDVELGNLRQLELIQRFFLLGRLGRAYALLKASPRLMESDPLARYIAGHVLLQLGKTEELGAIVDTMISSYPELSDSYVLRAEYEASRRNDDAAVDAYRTALDYGVPALANGLIRLFEAVHKYDIQHPHVALLTEVVNNRCGWLVWSAWIPKKGLEKSALSLKWN